MTDDSEQERWTDEEQMREDVRRTLSSIFAGGTYSITSAQMEAIEGALVDAVVDRLRGGGEVERGPDFPCENHPDRESVGRTEDGIHLCRECAPDVSGPVDRLAEAVRLHDRGPGSKHMPDSSSIGVPRPLTWGDLRKILHRLRDALSPTDGKETREENKACPECGTVPGGLWYVRGALADPPVLVCPACENRWPRYAAPDTEGREEHPTMKDHCLDCGSENVQVFSHPEEAGGEDPFEGLRPEAETMRGWSDEDLIGAVEAVADDVREAGQRWSEGILLEACDRIGGDTGMADRGDDVSDRLEAIRGAADEDKRYHGSPDVRWWARKAEWLLDHIEAQAEVVEAARDLAYRELPTDALREAFDNLEGQTDD